MLVGWVVLAVALDVALGAAVAAVHPKDEAPTTAGQTGASSPADTGSGQPLSSTCLETSTVRPEHRRYVDEASPDEQAWIPEYWCEFGRLTSEYVPYLFSRTEDTEQQMFNIEDGVRRSYEVVSDDPSLPVIWFFGGSTMFGWGQRDEHTIPSEVARLSEEAGLPVRVVNFGNLAWVHWQEVLAFERELAHRPAPDLVVFYDGVNDANVQGAQGTDSIRPSDDPTIYDFDDDPGPPLAPVLGTAPVQQEDESIPDRWAANSAVTQLARGVSGVLGMAPAPAAAAEAPPPDLVVQRTLEVYERGRALALRMAERSAVRARFFWQPRLGNVPDDVYEQAERDRMPPQDREIERAILDGLSEPTVDLSGAFDGLDPDDVFTDGAHTNERGARLVAEALWEHLAPDVEALDGTSGTGDG